LALQQAIPIGRKGLEVGVGTGRFAQALNIPYGVEPSRAMANLARKRGIELPQSGFGKGSFVVIKALKNS
jgi:hypothetical protein